MQELWKEVKGYEGLYEVSNTGKVRNAKTKIEKAQISNYNKKTGKGGYLTVTLSKDNKEQKQYVHRLVGFAFVDGYFNGARIDHINTNKKDNNASNLRWTTDSGNMNNPITKSKHDAFVKSEEFREMNSKRMKESNPAHTHRQSNTFVKQSKRVLCVETNETFESALQASNYVGVSEGCIAHCCNGHNHGKAKGYHWKYI